MLVLIEVAGSEGMASHWYLTTFLKLIAADNFNSFGKDGVWRDCNRRMAKLGSAVAALSCLSAVEC